MKVSQIISLFILLVFVSCKIEKKKSIDLNLLKRDWINAQYHYPLFFNDSTVFSHPWENNGKCVYHYKIAEDTLFINRNVIESSYNNWEKFKVLFNNRDVLILKNISKKDIYIEGDTLTLVSTSIFNTCEAKIKKIEFQMNLNNRSKSFTISNDTLKFIGEKNPDELKNRVFILTPKIKNQLNLKMKLIEPDCKFNLEKRFIDDKPLSIKIDLEDNYERDRTIIFDGYFPENFRLVLFVMYLYNIDEIVKYNNAIR